MLKSVNYTPNGYLNYSIAQTSCPQAFRGGGVNLSPNNSDVSGFAYNGVNANPSSSTSGAIQTGTVSNPTFRSQSQPTAQIPQTPPDTIEIFAENKIKTKKKEGLSTGAKAAIGIAAAVVAGIAAHKIILPMRVKSRVQRIFLEDFSKEEAKAIQKKYQDILKISDKDEFLDKLFAELKKDYKLDNIPIELNKDFKSGEKTGAITAAANFTNSYNAGFLIVEIDKTFDNKTLLKHLTHELRHAKQDVTMYQVVDSRDTLLAIRKAHYEDGNIIQLNKKELEECAAAETDEMIAFYKKLNIKKLSAGDRNYEWGRKVTDSHKTWANKSRDAYYSTFYETDAKNAEKLMDRMVHNKLWS